MTSHSSASSQKPGDEEIKQAVRERYAAAIAGPKGVCCGAGSSCGPSTIQRDPTGAGNYSTEELKDLPADSVENSFGCGNPLAFAGVRSDDVVLDIGSGAGIDVLLASRIVGPAGRVIGLDFTPEMVARGTENAARAGARNVEFRLGDAEQMPLEDSSVDWVISNCVINLAPDKHKVFSEVFRVLKPGGSVSISDIVTGELPAEITANLALWSQCVAGAIDEGRYLEVMREAGLVDVRVIDRQHYDEASLSSCLDSNVIASLGPEFLSKLIGRRKDIVNNIWSAKIVARKP